MKLTKAQTKLHELTCELLKQDVLAEDQKEFVLRHWRADADHNVTKAGAFFTPWGLAEAAAGECNGAKHVIDLCAGIGSLAYHRWRRDRPERLVCVEANPSYIAVGKKILPEAEWIQADVMELPDLGSFDLAISNPPFGRVAGAGHAPRYRGHKFEYRVIDTASRLAEQGAFILPQASVPFAFSAGAIQATERANSDYERFRRETGITLELGLGIDTRVWEEDWHGVKVPVESVRVEFPEVDGPAASTTAEGPA